METFSSGVEGIDEIVVPDDADLEYMDVYRDFELYRIKSPSGRTVGYMAEWMDRVETIQHATQRLGDLKKIVEAYDHDPAHPKPSL
jgi:hypothetical protein